MPGLVLENGSGLSRRERLTAGGLAHLLASADASPVREEFASSLAVAAMDGTVQRRFQDGTVAGQALLKTGSLEGVRALAGYVIDAEGRRFIVVAIINHPNAARGAAALDYLVQWVYREGADAGTRRCSDERRRGVRMSSSSPRKDRGGDPRRRVRRPAGRGQAARARRRQHGPGGRADGVPHPQERGLRAAASWNAQGGRRSAAADRGRHEDTPSAAGADQLALLETRLERARTGVPRASDYYAKLVAQRSSGRLRPTRIGRLSLNSR